jgi:hypothetical protein
VASAATSAHIKTRDCWRVSGSLAARSRPNCATTAATGTRMPNTSTSPRVWSLVVNSDSMVKIRVTTIITGIRKARTIGRRDTKRPSGNNNNAKR